MSTNKSMDAETLRKFYFSNSAKFGAFKTAQERQEQIRSSPTKAANDNDTSAVSLSNVSLQMPSAINQTEQQQTPASANKKRPSPSADTPSASGGDIVAAVPTAAVSSSSSTVGVQGLRSLKGNTSTKKAAAGPKPDAASAEYFEFLKQQQELQHQHTRIEETIASLEEGRRDRQGALVRLRRQSAELLQAIEDSADWKLRSRYDVGQLGRDCSLALQPCELVEERPPQYLGVQQLQHHLARIRDVHGQKDAYKQHQLFVEQGIRKLNMLETMLADKSNVDTSDISRIPDSLMVHLDKVCGLASIESIVASFEEQLDKCMFRTEEARKERDAAIRDGEVHVAEKVCYDIIEEHEKMLAEVIKKIHAVDKAMQETIVMEEVRHQFYVKTSPEFEVIVTRAQKLLERCQDDIKRMFALREKVEEVEAQAAKKVVQEQQRSNDVLRDNARKLETIFAKMEELEREVEVLERERHREIQKRVAEKDKDEHRKAEFAQFCSVVDAHLKPLERTIANMNVVKQSASIVKDFVEAGFKSLEEELAERKVLLKDVNLEAHKQHVEVFRGVLLELGEVVYKKERMIEETDKNIEQAHIQQELLAETFNPNAKKFGDVKKRLLANREELEADIGELRERAAEAMKNFTISEEALASQGVEYIHPVTQQEQHALAMRAHMMEVKALAIGHHEGHEVLRDISQLKEQLNASKSEIEAMNAATSGTMSRTLPMIRAAQKARSKVM